MRVAAAMAEEGSAVAALAVLLATASVGIAVVGAGSALAARQRVVGAADAAALAAADAVSGAVAGVPCERAAQLARANGADLSSCDVDGAVASVTVTTGVLGVPVRASARAGPPTDGAADTEDPSP